MATRSVLAAKFSDGSIKAIYVHYDGDKHFPILQEKYNTQEKVEAFILCGDRQTMGVAYNDDSSSPEELGSLEEAKDLDWGQEYIYLWDGSEWTRYKAERKPYIPTFNDCDGLVQRFAKWLPCCLCFDREGEEEIYTEEGVMANYRQYCVTGDIEEWAYEWLQEEGMDDESAGNLAPTICRNLDIGLSQGIIHFKIVSKEVEKV